MKTALNYLDVMHVFKSLVETEKNIVYATVKLIIRFSQMLGNESRCYIINTARYLTFLSDVTGNFENIFSYSSKTQVANICTRLQDIFSSFFQRMF